jgi:hypothetical protein
MGERVGDILDIDLLGERRSDMHPPARTGRKEDLVLGSD